MYLFNLSPELSQQIFEEIIQSRDFLHIMRLRLVSRQFKNCIDEVVFRLRLLDQFSYRYDWFGKTMGSQSEHYQAWHTYVCSYLAYQIARKGPSKSFMGRVYGTAHAICQQNGDGDVRSEAFTICLESLVRLAAPQVPGVRIEAKSRVSFSMRTLLEDFEELPCSEEDLKADIHVASIYLGRMAYVERLVTEGVQFCSASGRDDVKSCVFGYAFTAAAIRGELDIIRLLLSCIPEHNTTGIIPGFQQDCILRHSRSRSACLFALESPIKRNLWTIESAARSTPWPDVYERATAILGHEIRMSASEPTLDLTALLSLNACRGDTEMVRYILSKGITPNNTLAHRDVAFGQPPAFKPLLRAVMHRHKATVEALLDAGADPNWYSPYLTALMLAVHAGSLAITELLLDHGADVNEGYPPPIVFAVLKERIDIFRLLRRRGARLDTPETGGWAMEVARLSDHHPMVDLLIDEGVGEDVILHRVARRNEFYDSSMKLSKIQFMLGG